MRVEITYEQDLRLLYYIKGMVKLTGYIKGNILHHAKKL